MIFEACKKYNIDQQKEVIFLFGFSFGGLVASRMASSVIGSSMFSGVIYNAPFFKDFDGKLVRVYPFCYAVSFVAPKFGISSKSKF